MNGQSRNRVVGIFSLVILVVGLAGPAMGQKTPDVEGGTFRLGDRSITLTKDDIARHYAFVQGLNPRLSHADLYEAAWARAIRLQEANDAGIEAPESEFRAWMAKRHASRRMDWTDAEGHVLPERLQSYVARFGCKDVSEYEARCREEFLSERFVEASTGTKPPTDEEVRRRFDSLFQTLKIETFVLAPETLARRPKLSRDSEEDRALFRSWWASLPERMKLRYDDAERPAIEAEVIYARFDDKTAESFKAWFTTPLPGPGKSMAELTQSYALDDVARARLFERWRETRRGGHAWLNRSVTPGLDDEQSFRQVLPGLEREWKVIRYMGELWKRLDEGQEPLDNMKEVAKRWGLEYRHIPLTALWRLTRRESGLPGDHPIHIAKTEPGSLFRYKTNPQKGSSLYFVDGVVDQIGRHASIWRLLAKEPLRAPTADEAMQRAWSDFEDANAWRLAEAMGRRVTQRLMEKLPAKWKAKRTDPEFTAGRRQALKPLFNLAVGGVKDGRVLGPFVVRPFQPEMEAPLYRGALGRRISNVFRTKWPEVGGPLGTLYASGDVLDPYIDTTRRLYLIPRILEVILPGDHRWEQDATARATARDSLLGESRREQFRKIRSHWRWPGIVLKYQLKAPHFEKAMAAERIGRSK